MVAFERLVSDAWSRVDHRLAAVPVLTALLQFDKVERVVGFRGGHFGVTFRFPTPVTDAWTFVGLPNQGGGVNVTGPLPLLAALVAVRAALAAGYLGSVHRSLSGRDLDFVGSIQRYGPSILGYQVLVFAVGLLGVALAVGGLRGAGALVLLLGLPAYVVLGYLFFATPYLVVARDLALGDALARSYRLATSPLAQSEAQSPSRAAAAGGDYLDFAWKYLVAVALASLAGTALVVNGGMSGVLAGAVLAAPVGLALDAATMAFLDGYDAL